MEKNDGIERILHIMRYYNLSQRQFALKINVSPQAFNSMIVKNYELKLSTIIDILKAFSEVRIEWFVMGEEPMIGEKKPETEADSQFRTILNNKYISSLEDHIATLKETNARLVKEVKELKREKSFTTSVTNSILDK